MGADCDHDHDRRCPICHDGVVLYYEAPARWPEPYPAHDLEAT